ncbi:predicted protein [Botrytis cinerea T4]|uniref:Uncharacterized protein n=1 Tax=Botryotinia fuckeliana (strain T4) TaxID=999810 RepID=G2YKU4_BOTF4|nr:predicted protein [Botrytis cinerea T4]
MVGIGKAIRYGLNMQLEGIYGWSPENQWSLIQSN